MPEKKVKTGLGRWGDFGFSAAIKSIETGKPPKKQVKPKWSTDVPFKFK